MYKKYILLFILSCCTLMVQAQQYKSNFTKESIYKDLEYLSGRLLFKLKPQYRDIVILPSERSPKVASSFEKLQLKATQMFHEKFLRRRLSSRVRNFSGVDVSLFYFAQFDDSIPLEDVIRELKALGVFEYVEPDLVHKVAFEPSDRLLGQQYYLRNVNAFDAWAITKGSDDIIIGIVDSGSEFNHPDLESKFYTNPLEIPDNGIDDDQNGYIDDIRGWDFAGSDTARIRQDNDAQIDGEGFNLHGTWVGGVAGAKVDNETGIAGVGFNSRLLTTKHAFDNQRENDSRLVNSIGGVIYMIENRVDVMNLSYGSNFRSDIQAEIFKVATEDEDIVVVAAAGNDNTSRVSYPAGYPNVISVAALDIEDKEASFTNIGRTIDVAAPGVEILTTGEIGINYETVDGTSFASPIVAGAAALMRSHYPDFSARQIAQQIRITANPSIYDLPENISGTLGSGKLDIFAALNERKPGIIYENISITNTKGDENIQGGDTILITGNFTNLLFPSTPNLEAKLVAENRRTQITEIKNSIKLGEIAEGQVFNNKSTPFMFKIAESARTEIRFSFRLDFTDEGYSDFQVFDILINPSIINIERNLISTSIANNGRFGFREFDGDKGLGVVFKEENLLFEMGLLMGTSSSDISSTVRSDTVNGRITVDNHFRTLSPILSNSPGERSVFEAFGTLNNSRAKTPTQVEIDYRSMVFTDDPNDQYVILEYDITNTDTVDINDYYVGLYADWDIGIRDLADWNSEFRLGYIYSPETNNSAFAGIQELTGKPNYYPINNNERAPNSPFGVYDGFTDEEKFISLSSKESVLSHASMPSGSVNDMSHTVSSGPYDIPVGESIQVAFAIHAGENLEDILVSAEAADKKYNQVFNLTKPSLSFTPTCLGGTVDITATGSGEFKWYSEKFGGDPFFEGNNYTTSPLLEDTVLYVSRVENGIESLREVINVRTTANPQITVTGSTQLCEGETTTLTALLADSYLWSNGETTRSISVSEAGEYTLTVTDNSLGCSNTSEPITITVDTPPTADFNISLETSTQIQFTDLSTNAIDWQWDFGNGTTSQEQNPTVEFDEIGEFTISLTVKSASGCTSIATKTFQVTSLADAFQLQGVTVFPNPNKGMFVFSLENDKLGRVEIQLSTIEGKIVYSESLIKKGNRLQKSIDVSRLSKGLYFLKTMQEDKFTVKRVVRLD